MSDNIWDDPDLRQSGEYVTFNNPGDKVTGTVLSIRKHKFDDGSVAPQILLTDDSDGEERTVTAGQIRLKAALAEKRPQVGDRISIELTQVEKRAGGKTLKHFDVTVTPPGNAPAAPAPAAAPAAAPAVDQAALAAALAGMSAEQKAALGL